MNIKNLILLLAVLVLAAFSRLTGLEKVPPSLFSDEVDIGYQVKSLFATGNDYEGNFLPLQFHSFSDVRTSLPIYATAIVSKIPGIGLDFAIRLTPAIFSLISIFLVYFLINNLFELFKLKEAKENSIEPGIWGTLILTLMPWHFTYSRIGFELSMLFLFFVAGIHFYTKYLLRGKVSDLIFGLILLSLTPMVYSTAKLAVIFYPLILALIPGGYEKLRVKKNFLFLIILLIPMAVLLINGGAGKRFGEISVFTDPTIASETDFSRKADLGPNPQVGSSPSIFSKIAHNKLIFVGNSFLKNITNPLSAGYLFLQGDTNPRHAVQGFGMLQKTLIIPLLIGLYFLASKKQERFFIFLGVLLVSAIGPAALTRDGWNHSSRTFMMIFPLLIIICIGLVRLKTVSTSLTFLFLSTLFFESFLYFHTYWLHYPYEAQRDWTAGMKETAELAVKNPEKAIVISRRYEPPLIFFLYYANFPPQRFQELFKEKSFLTDVDGKMNLEGNRFADSHVYFASIKDGGTKDPFKIKNSIYLMTKSEINGISPLLYTSFSSNIALPSGEILFYVITPKEAIPLDTNSRL